MSDDKLKSADELRQIARDVLNGRVFTERHCQSQRDFQTVFGGILGMMTEDAMRKVAKRHGGMGCLYEYLESASPRSVNGLPFFLSFRILTPTEAKFMWKKYEQYRAALEAK